MKRYPGVVACIVVLAACCLCACLALYGCSGSATSLCAQLGMPETELTVEPDLQEAAESLLADNEGSIVVLESRTGRIRAIASSDTAAGNHKACKRAIPGSTFKTVTLCAALEKDSDALSDYYSAPVNLTTSGGIIVSGLGKDYGSMSLQEAYARSCNTVFAQLAWDVGEKRIVTQAEKFGLGAEPHADFPCEASIVAAGDPRDEYTLGWFGCGQAIQGESGQTGPLVTPVQLAQLYAAFENDGVVPRAWVRADSEKQTDGEDAHAARAVSVQTCRAVNRAMRTVVAEGTGTNAAVTGVAVGGKTGTAENADGTTTGWFCGNARSGGAHVTVVVQLEGTVSANAAKVAAEVIGEAL